MREIRNRKSNLGQTKQNGMNSIIILFNLVSRQVIFQLFTRGRKAPESRFRFIFLLLLLFVVSVF